jgi:hypothetical protein
VASACCGFGTPHLTQHLTSGENLRCSTDQILFLEFGWVGSHTHDLALIIIVEYFAPVCIYYCVVGPPKANYFVIHRSTGNSRPDASISNAALREERLDV